MRARPESAIRHAVDGGHGARTRVRDPALRMATAHESRRLTSRMIPDRCGVAYATAETHALRARMGRATSRKRSRGMGVRVSPTEEERHEDDKHLTPGVQLRLRPPQHLKYAPAWGAAVNCNAMLAGPTVAYRDR